MSENNKKYKILLVGDSLANGGAERVQALLSNYFHNCGIDVHHVIFLDWVTYEFSGHLLNLGKISPNATGFIKKAKRVLVLKRYIQTNNFDAVIDFRMRNTFLKEFFLSRFILPKETFYTVHSGILEYYFPRNNMLSKIIYYSKNVIAVSKAIQKKILEEKIVKYCNQIYNPIDLKQINLLKQEFEVTESNYILAVGRMNDNVKQFDKLIISYSKSVLPEKNIKLVLLGEGKNRKNYEALAKSLNISDRVIFKGFVENPFPFYKNALFTILSSSNEGFPNVIIESIATNTPVISFDCFSGPNEIIANNVNGFLVENQNFEKLTETINKMYENSIEYSLIRNNTISKANQFDIEIIGKQWLELLKIN